MPTPPRPVTPAGILAMALARLCQRADALGDVDPELRDGLRDAQALAAGLEPYVSECTSPESPELTTLARRTAEHDWEQRGGAAVALEQEMLSGHVEGQTLQFLIAATRATQVLEIGMFTGYSALAMAEALPQDGRVVACELDPEAATFAQRNFDETAAGAKVEVRVGPAQSTLQQLAAQDRSFDLVFIDADKGGYLGYLQTILDRGLLATGGVICVDNTLLQGEPYLSGERSPNGEAIAAFNAAVAADPRVRQVLLPVRDGLTLIRIAS
jgi:caffeoyl-CoA O-methyltransferase